MKKQNFIQKRSLVGFFLILSLFVSAAPPQAYAEESQAVSCFDYYQFGSVQVNISPTSGVFSGTRTEFPVVIKNNNDYPIINGAVYIKIFRKSGLSQSSVQKNGHDVVDQYVAAKGVTLAAKSEVTATLFWDVPAGMPTGDYQIAAFFLANNTFEILGLPFTDDITGATRDFKISGELSQRVSLSKGNVSVDGKTFIFAGMPPFVEKDKPSVIEYDLVSTLANPQLVIVKTTLYFWDASDEKKVIDSETKEVVVSSNAPTRLSFTASDSSHPVYLLIVESDHNGVKSFLNIRFVREGINEPRVNFLALSSYPLKKGEPTSVFACLHNSGIDFVVSGSELQVALRDTSTKEILGSFIYTGDVSGPVMGRKMDITPNKDLYEVTLEAKLLKDGKVIDEISIPYECSSILGSSGCPAPPSSSLYLYIIGGIFVLILAVLAFVGRGMLKPKIAGPLVLVVILAGLVLSQGLTQKTSAVGELYGFNEGGGAYADFVSNLPLSMPTNSVMWSGGGNPDSFPFDFRDITPYFPGGGNFSFSYQAVYGITVTDVTQPSQPTEISNGAIVPVGTVLKIASVPQSNDHISWFLKGNFWGSPYGYWDTPALCAPSDALAFFKHGLVRTDGSPRYTSQYHVPMTIQTPTLSVTPGGTATLIPTAPNTYRVTGGGTITLDAIFAENQGRADAYTNGYIKDIRCFYADCTGTIVPETCTLRRTYNFTIPQQHILFNLSAPTSGPGSGSGGGTNVAPGAPTVTTTSSAAGGAYCTNDAITVTFSSTDPEGDQLYYQVLYDPINPNDWSNALRVPPSQTAFVPSGTSISAPPKTFSLTGNHTILVRARDAQGNISTVTSRTINFTDCSASSTIACPFTAQPNRTIVNFDGGSLCSDPDASPGCPEQKTENVALVAGNYDITLVAYDSYPARVGASQPNESWKLRLTNGGTILFTSAGTPDLADNVVSDMKVFATSAVLSSSANTAIALHTASPAPNGSNPNSVKPICAVLDLRPPPPPPALQVDLYIKEYSPARSFIKDRGKQPSFPSSTAGEEVAPKILKTSQFQIAWQLQGATNCTASPSGSFIPTTSSGSETVFHTVPTGPITYSLRCTNSVGTIVTNSVTVTPKPPTSVEEF